MKARLVALTVVIGAGVITAPFVRGQATQSDAALPKWEAISIKPCPSGNRAPPAAQGPGRMSMPCAPVELFIHHSFLLFPNGVFDLGGSKTPVEGGPAWMYSEPYTIEATAETVPGQAAPGQGTMQGPMLRALLADRFKLQVHRGTKLVPAYALTVGKNGPGLQATPEGSCVVGDNDHPPPPPEPGQTPLPLCGFPGFMNDGLDFHGVTMAQLCSALSRFADRQVIDKTGFAGNFDIRLNLPLQAPPPGEPPPDPGEITARIQSALQKFGLKLESTQAPEDILIVDHVERPNEN